MLPSEELWQANKDIVHSCFHSSFVQSLGNGKLDKEDFVLYLAQDAFLLEAMARTYSVAAAKAPDFYGFSVLHQMIAQLIEALGDRHQEIFLRNETNIQAVPRSQTQRYTDFLISTAWTEDMGVILNATVPYLKLHLELGMLMQCGNPQQTYRNWGLTYSSERFQETVAMMDGLVDRYANSHQARYSVYRHSLLLLRLFFDALAPTLTQAPPIDNWTLVLGKPVWES